MRLPELLEKRAAKIGRMRALMTAAETRGADLSDAERTEYDALENEVRALNQQIERAQRLDALERAASATSVPSGAPDYDRARREVRLLDAVNYLAGTPGVDAERLLEVSQQIARDQQRSTAGLWLPTEIMQTPRFGQEQRVVTSAGGGAGAVFTEHHPELYTDELVAASVVGAAGAFVIPGLVGNFSAPANDVGASAQWIGDNESITPGDIDVNARTMQPKHLGAIIPFSNNMRLQASPQVEILARRTFAGQFAAGLDGGALGTLTDDDAPQGILQVITPGTFATPSWAEGLGLISSLATNNALIDDGTLAWVGHPQCSAKLQSTVRVANTDSRFIQEDPRSLYGYRYFNSTALVGNGSPADRSIVFGRFSDLLIGIWRDLELLVNPYGDAFASGGVEVRGLLSADVVLRHEQSFAGANDMDTTLS